MLIFAVLLWLLQGAAPGARLVLVPERGASFSFSDDVLDLKSGGGWLRSKQVFLDFDLEFEYRAAAPASDAGLLVRTWSGEGQWPDKGYRIRLPTGSPETSTSVEGRKQPVAIVEERPAVLRPADDWQKMSVRARGSRVQVTLNDAILATFDIETFGGHILFDARKGRVLLRNITVLASDAAFELPAGALQSDELKRAGGTQPKVLREIRAVYTPEAMRAVRQGVCLMEAIVLDNGSVGPVRVTRSLDPELDRAAMAALRGWKFVPAMLQGKAVPVVVQVEISFSLR